MVRLKFGVVLCVIAAALTLIGAPAAIADSVTGQGTVTSTAYRGGNSNAGGVNYAVGVQVYRDSAGTVTKVRGAARMTKLSKVSRVQVDSVTLGTASRAVSRNSTPLNSGAASTVTSYTNWVPVKAGTCTDFRARGVYSIRWTDGGLSTLNIQSPLTRVCRSAAIPSKPADRDCPDFATQAQAQAFFDRYYPYYGDFARLDADNDRKACEDLP